MQTNNKSSSGTAVASPAASAAAQATACAPCEIPPFCRSYFYTGKLLTESDLNREQRYAMDKLRLHYVALHGWGVACGLMVRPHPQCPDRFVVTPGFAVDDCGREIRLLKECVTMFPKPPEPARDPCPPDPCGDKDDEEIDVPPPPRRGQTYYVCIRYNECQEDFMPVVFADCCGTANQPNRVCECATVELLLEPPACLGETESRRESRRDENCHELWKDFSEKCPPTGKTCCIPLAVIRDYVYCERFVEEMIDNSIRPVLPSVPRLEEQIHCVMEHLPKPTPRLTHIARIHWDHDREYHPGEFLYEFVGTKESPRGFEIEFDGRVHQKGLNTRTFQATIVREPPDRRDPRIVEIAPARVIRSEDGNRCTLYIDPEYARHQLHEHNFDVFITLRCDKVLDERGLAVDGNLLASSRQDEDHDYMVKLPTGDGVPGGLFESWIRVRRER
ncbi:MAG TPA: hypothetical protein VGG72_25590 [Bryobacteraceae bacterium]|jgi:hypothetical protein